MKLIMYKSGAYQLSLGLTPKGGVPPKRKAGDIQLLSRKSRKRLLQKLLMMTEAMKEQDLYFITLTSKYVFQYKHLIALLKRQQRRGMLSAVWKREFQVRGNVHVHILAAYARDAWADGPAQLPADWLLVTGKLRGEQVDVRPVKSVSSVLVYIAKYLTKDDTEAIQQAALDYNAKSCHHEEDNTYSYEISRKYWKRPWGTFSWEEVKKRYTGVEVRLREISEITYLALKAYASQSIHFPDSRPEPRSVEQALINLCWQADDCQ